MLIYFLSMVSLNFISIYYNDRNDSLHLELLLCRPQQDVVYLHVRGAGQDVGDSGGDVAAL